MKKRLLAMLMALALLVSLMPMGVLAVGEPADDQIVNDGGTVFYDKDGNTVTAGSLGENDSVVEMSKTVEETDDENEFLVTLNVRTNQNLTELSSTNPDAAVVLVLDVSGSMDWCVNCGKTKNQHYGKNNLYCYKSDSSSQYQSRLDAAKDAANDFLNDFAELTAGEGETAHRWVKIIKFESDARIVNENWIDVSTSEGLYWAKYYVNSLDANGGTNIEAGLQLAKNNLAQRSNSNSAIYDVDYLYTILLTDGKPTYGTSNKNDNSTKHISGSGSSGSETNYSDVDDAETFAQAIRSMSSASRLYSICFGTDSNGDEVWEDKLLDYEHDVPHDFDEDITVKDWLSKLSNGAYSGGADGSDLLENFQSIVTQIALATKAFRVTDTMGQYMTNAAIQSVSNGQGGSVNNVASIDGNTLNWNILASEEDGTSTYEENEDGTVTGYLSYTLKYTVTLDNLAATGVINSTNVNESATLTYAVQKEDGTWDGDVKTGTFAIPQVKSLYGELTFTKIGSDTQKALAGATFTLTAEDDSDWYRTATSDNDGTVTFSDISSGHIYTLSETATPEGYQEHEDITITVSYGEVSYQDGTFGGSAGSLTLTNQASTGTLTVTKTVTGLDNGVTLPDDFKIEVKNSEGTVVQTLTTSNADSGAVSGTTYTWTCNLAPGTYTVTESNYQVDGYSVEVSGNDPTVNVSAGETATYDLTNTYTEQVPGLEVTKTLDKVNDVTYVNGSMVKVGDTLTYTITVTNTGTTTLTGVVVTDTITGDGTVNLEASDKENVTITGTTAKIDSLAPKASVTITATYEVVSTDAGETITNTAVAESNDTKDEPENPPEVKVENPKLTVTKTAAVGGEPLDDNASVNICDEITYTITVTNDGNTTFDKVYVYDEMMVGDVQISVNGETSTTVTLDGGYTIEPTGGFNPNDVVTLTYSYKATEDDIESGISNTAVAEGGDTKDDDTVEIDVNDPSVSINKEVTGYNDKAMEGDELTYTITVRNTGNTKLNVTVSDDMWTYGKVSSAELNGVGIDVTSGKYTIVGLDAGESKAITYTYTVTTQDVANGKIYNAATADIDGDGIPDDKYEVTTPTGDPSLTVEKTADASTVQVGTPITYTVEVKNDGYSVMNNVVISDTLWTSDTAIEAIGDVTGEYDTGESKYYIGKLEPGEYVTLTYTYTPTEAGGLENKVTVTSDDLDTVPEDSVIVDVTPEPTPDEPGISVTKTVSDRTPDVGDTITYYINVENTGNTVIDEFTVKDSMWEYGMPIYVDGELAYVNSDDAYTVKTADLEPGSSITISYTYSVRYADEGDRITNYVTVTTPGDGPSDGDYVIIDVDDITPIVPDPDDDDDDDTVYVPNWLNTTDHFAYLIGYEDGEIKPENNITRAEVATIFFRLLTDDARARFWSSENDYTDVATDSWYNNAVSTLSNMGIINGYEDGTFQPNASITRAEFTAIATRFFDYTAEYDGAFNDVASGSWYADYVQAAVDMGLVDGYPDGGFHPNSYITRAEAVTIVNRVLNRVPHEDYLLSTRVMNTWPDNVYGAWYYADMQEATNSHDYDWIRVSGERVEEWTEKLTERDWAALEQQWSTAYSG